MPVRRLFRLLTLVGARVAGASITLGLALYVARTYGAHYSGSFYLFLSAVAVLGILTRLGTEAHLTAAVTPRVGGQEGTLHLLIAALVAVTTLVGLAATALVVVELSVPGTRHWAAGGLDDPVLLAGSVLGFNYIWTISAYFRAVGWATRSILVENALMTLWLWPILAFWPSKPSPPPVDVVAMALVVLAPVLLLPTLASYCRHGGSSRSVTRSDIVEAMRGVTSFASVMITNSVIVWIPMLALGFFGLIAEAGVYNAAFRIAMAVGAFGVIIKSGVIKARLGDEGSRSETREDRLRVVRMSAILGLAFGAGSLAIALFSGPLSSAFGAGFGAVSAILPILLLAQSINVAGYPVETHLVLNGDKRSLSLNAAFTIVVAAIATPVLIGLFGLVGAAWSFAVTITGCRLHMAAAYLRSSSPRTS